MTAPAVTDAAELDRLYRIEVNTSLIVNVLGAYLDEHLPIITAILRADLAREG